VYFVEHANLTRPAHRHVNVICTAGLVYKLLSQMLRFRCWRGQYWCGCYWQRL